MVELLTSLTEQCTQLLDVEAAGLLLADPRQRLHLMAATSERSRGLELFQLQAEEGPCLDCYAHGEPVSVADLSEERHRWPQFVPAATDAGWGLRLVQQLNACISGQRRSIHQLVLGLMS